MSLDKVMTEGRRLKALEVLAAYGASAISGTVLHKALNVYGHPCTYDQVRATIRWLHDQGLAVSTDLDGGAVRVAVTTTGRDVAGGLPWFGVAVPFVDG